MKITRGFLGLQKAKSKVKEAVAGVQAGVLEGLYRNPGHPKVTRARAKQRIFRIQRSGTNPYRAAIDNQNKLIEMTARGKTALQNPGTSVAEGIKWVAENPGAAVGGAVNAVGVGAAAAAGNPALAGIIQATPLMPGGAILDQQLQRRFPKYKSVLQGLGKGADVVTSPIRDISSNEILSVGRVLSGSAFPGDFQAAGGMFRRSGDRVKQAGHRIINRGKALFRRKPAASPQLVPAYN